MHEEVPLMQVQGGTHAHAWLSVTTIDALESKHKDLLPSKGRGVTRLCADLQVCHASQLVGVSWHATPAHAPITHATQWPMTTHSLASAACSFFGRTASMICFSSTMGYSSHILAARERGRALSRTVQAGQHAVLQSCGINASRFVKVAAWLHQSLLAMKVSQAELYPHLMPR